MVGDDERNSMWHDTQDILRAERVEESVEKVTLISEELPSQDIGGDDESVAGCHFFLDLGKVPQSAAASVA
ncbi:hypothetical protein KI387_037909, partial [Taxus chinensis]